MTAQTLSGNEGGDRLKRCTTRERKLFCILWGMMFVLSASSSLNHALFERSTKDAINHGIVAVICGIAIWFWCIRANPKGEKKDSKSVIAHRDSVDQKGPENRLKKDVEM